MSEREREREWRGYILRLRRMMRVGGRIKLLVEELDLTQARLFSNLNLGKFIAG